ncbi:MAG: short-chain fatty acid transporter [Candidatus Eisenbacteria bacterium]|uniref:Short-chain fatty acid transporter n=1 Tax=Eiseniibacteriota bacterium TaxID=2212470 RepID=A0A538SN30_UNCEI|nr:MAG: short-chain fatty acid transporter [Candidatus Eisenbacteria bacterium]
MQIHVRFARAATRLTNWTQRWVPGTFTIAWFLTLIVLILGVTAGRASFLTCVAAWGDGFWELLPFSMQMCLIMFTGSVVAVSPPVRRALAWLASRPRTPRQSILLVALCSMLLALIHWGISIVGSAVLVRELGRRRAGADYRLLLAAAYLGMGTTWHAGLSASAPLLVATPGHFLESEIGIIPVSATIFSSFNLILVAIVVLIFSIVTPLLHPAPAETIEATPAQLEAIHVFEPPHPPAALKPAPATKLEFSRWVNLTFGALALVWVVDYIFVRTQHPVTLNVLNFVMMGLAIALHPSAASLVAAAEEASGLVFGIILQFPLYAGMYGIIRETHLAESLAGVFVAGATAHTYPVIVYWYSGIVNYFVPSGGSKWAIEAPYILAAGKTLGVPAAKVVTAYAWGDMVTDIIQPFWAIPLLAAARLDFREILGFCMILFCIYAPVVTLAFLLFPR